MDINLNQQAPVTSQKQSRAEFPEWRKERTDELQKFSKVPAQQFIFDLNDKQLKQENQLKVMKRLSSESYLVYHAELQRQFMLKNIQNDEDIHRWINLPTHSNIVTAFAQQEIKHRDETQSERVSSKFQLVEPSNLGGMYGFVGNLGQELTERVNLRNKVEKERAELEIVSYLISKPPKTKDSLKNRNKNKGLGPEEEYIDEGWSRFEGQKPKFKMNLDNEEILREYTKFIYDVAIQISTGLEHAHSFKLYHGLLDTSKIIVHKIMTQQEKVEIERQQFYEAKRQKGEMIIEGEDEPKILEPQYHFKITDFAPNQAKNEAFGIVTEKDGKPPLPKWEFLYKKADLKEEDKEELLMLKDIYTLGVCILELMIGRFGTQSHLLTINMLPGQWANQPASQPLIDIIEECLNLDQNSTRQGLLKKMRSDLLENYKRFFWRPEEAYKNEFPFVGSISNVHNKLGIMQIFKMKESENQSEIYLQALREFKQARKLQKNNMNVTFNENLLKFNWPFNSDYYMSPEQFQAELENCEGGYNGRLLQCFTQARLGQPKQAVATLKDYRLEVNGALAYEEAKLEAAQKNPPKQIKQQQQSSVQKQREREVDQMIAYIEDHKDQFIQSQVYERRSESGLSDGSIISNLAFTSDSKHLIAAQKGLVSVYSLNGWEPITLKWMTRLDNNQEPCLCVANDLVTEVAVYFDSSKSLVIYEVNKESKEPQIKIQVKIEKGQAQSSFKPQDMYFSEDGLKLIIYFLEGKKQAATLIEYDISSGKFTQTQHQKNQLFLDRKIGAGFVKQTLKDVFNTQITREASDLISVPLKESEFFARLQTTEPQALFIYSNMRRRNIRYYQWNGLNDRAFSMSADGNMIAIACQESILVESVRIPSAQQPFDKFTRFRFVTADDQVKNVDNFSGKKTAQQRILRDIQNYKIFESTVKVVEKKFVNEKKDINNSTIKSLIQKQVDAIGESMTQGMTKNLIVELMLLKYNKMIEKPSTMKNNKEFLIMQKILMDESQKEFEPDQDAQSSQIWNRYELNRFKATKRIAVYDKELPRGQIKMIQMSSRPTKNFMLVMIDGKIFKYDLATKLLECQFEALDQPDDMILYEDDNKLCVYNKDEVQLWDFDGEGESLPYLFEDEFFEVKDKNVDGVFQTLDKLYINENCENYGDEKRNRIFLLDFQQCFRIYKGSRFDNEYIEVDNLGDDETQVTAVSFSNDNSMIYVADTRGRVLYISTADGKATQEPTVFFNLMSNQEQAQISFPDRDLAVSFMMRFWMYQRDKREALNHFLVILGDRLPYIFDKPAQKLTSLTFGEDETNIRLGKKFIEDEEFKICNAQVALNSQFFIVGWTKNKKKAGDVNRTVVSNYRQPNAMNISLQVANPRINQTEAFIQRSGVFSPRISAAGSRNPQFDSNIKSGIGIWKINKDDQTLTFINWVTEVDFVNFSVDDHCATITYWTRQGGLDLHYLLWDFLVTGITAKEMETLKLTDAEQFNPVQQSKKDAAGEIVEELQSDEENDQVPLSELKKMKNMQSKLCTLF